MWECGSDEDDIEEEEILLGRAGVLSSARIVGLNQDEGKAVGDDAGWCVGNNDVEDIVFGIGKVDLTGSAGGVASIGPARVLLVLDLNGLLVERVAKVKDKDIKARVGKPGGPLNAGKYWAFLRPGHKQFVQFLFDKFDVLAWSSAQMKNIEALLNVLLNNEQLSNLVGIFDQESCTKACQDPKNPYKPLFLKPLCKVYKAYPKYSALNTLLVDDSLYKSVENEEFTSIHPKEWTRDMKNDKALLPGGSIREYLEKLACSASTATFRGVPSFVKAHPFDCGYSAKELDEQKQLAETARKGVQELEARRLKGDG
mmetsp:Transcript_10931/g.17910  ORF Transcript_10931/g.17910 Transcript_10931/m.17910 type:complete len:313 (+) Transcript_10931:3-941(+)